MTVSLETLNAAVTPAVNDAGMSLPQGTILFWERQDVVGFYEF